MASFKNSLRIPAPFKRTIKNPATNQNATGKIYTVMDNSRKLSQQKVISAPGSNASALQDSLAILSAFGMTVAEQSENINTTILTDKFLDNSKLEKLTKTQDDNPNRPQEKKFEKLKTKKVAASKIFNQALNNPINELDIRQSNYVRSKRVSAPNAIDLTDEFINYSTLPLVTRLKIK